MTPFAYHRPADLVEAGRLQAAEGAAILAGGQSLLRDMKRGLRRQSALVDVSRLLGRGIRSEAGAIVIDAGATHAEVAASPLLRDRIPMLAGMVHHIADPQVRHRATLGGAFAANEPAGDYPAAALSLAATVVTSARSMPAEAFFTGAGTTALAPDEIVVAVAFPIPAKAGYAKILNPAARYALVGACAAVGSDGAPRLAITGAATAGAFQWRAAEAALVLSFAAVALADVDLPALPMREDLFADQGYRRHLVRVMAGRAVDAADGADPVRVFSHGGRIPGGARC